MIEVWDRVTVRAGRWLCSYYKISLTQSQLRSTALWRSIVAVQQRLAPYKPLELIIRSQESVASISSERGGHNAHGLLNTATYRIEMTPNESLERSGEGGVWISGAFRRAESR